MGARWYPPPATYRSGSESPLASKKLVQSKGGVSAPAEFLTTLPSSSKAVAEGQADMSFVSPGVFSPATIGSAATFRANSRYTSNICRVSSIASSSEAWAV